MLQFNKMEAVAFGEVVATPNMNAERRARLGSLKLSNEVKQEDLETLASVFPEEYRSKIVEFMSTQMGVTDLIVLQAYLTQGERGLERLSNLDAVAIERSLDKVEKGTDKNE